MTSGRMLLISLAITIFLILLRYGAISHAEQVKKENADLFAKDIKPIHQELNCTGPTTKDDCSVSKTYSKEDEALIKQRNEAIGISRWIVGPINYVLFFLVLHVLYSSYELYKDVMESAKKTNNKKQI